MKNSKVSDFLFEASLLNTLETHSHGYSLKNMHDGNAVLFLRYFGG